MYGVSVDSPEISEKLRKSLQLNFELLSDQERRVITDWTILNSGERGGLAHPNVYVINSQLEIIYHSKDNLRSRADPKPLLEFIERYQADSSVRVQNEKRSTMKPLLLEYILALPKKWRFLE